MLCFISNKHQDRSPKDSNSAEVRIKAKPCGQYSRRPFSIPILEQYLRDLRDTHATGEKVKETSFYPALANLLNDSAMWENVPARVWDYTIGGYQVIKKWLSYREFNILGRSLSTEEAREVTQIARRIAVILLLESALDENYLRVKAQSYNWQDKMIVDE